jgi:hypothetical protein
VSNGLLEIYNKVRNSKKSECVRYIELDKEDVQRSKAAKTILDIYETKPVSVEAKKSVAFSINENLSSVPVEYDETNQCSSEFEYFEVYLNQTDCVFPEKKNMGLNDDAALIPLKHIKQLRNFKE